MEKRYFSNVQWFISQAHHRVHAAAFSKRKISHKEFREITNQFLDLAPQTLWVENLKGNYHEVSDARDLDRICHYKELDKFSGTFSQLYQSREDLFSNNEGPTAYGVCHASDEPDEFGNRSFMCLTTSHALFEGADLVEIMRGKSAYHGDKPPEAEHRASLLSRVTTTILTPIIAILHLLQSNLLPAPDRGHRFEAVELNSKDFRKAARRLGLSQRGLAYAFVLYHFTIPNRNKFPIVAYLSLRDPGVLDEQDDYLQMKTRLFFPGYNKDFLTYAKKIDKILIRQAGKPHPYQQLNIKGFGFHRRLARFLPFLYGKKLFEAVPYDMILSMTPPIRPIGALGKTYDGPVFGASSLGKGRNCTFIPGKNHMTMTFYAEGDYYKVLPKFLEELRKLDIKCNMAGEIEA